MLAFICSDSWVREPASLDEKASVGLRAADKSLSLG